MDKVLKGEAAIRYAARHGLSVYEYMGPNDDVRPISPAAARVVLRQRGPDVLSIGICASRSYADKSGLTVEEFLARRHPPARPIPDFNDVSAPTVRRMTLAEFAQHTKTEPLTRPYLKGKAS